MSDYLVHVRELSELFEAGKYPKVLMLARNALSAPLAPVERATVLWWQARAYVAAGEFEQALRHALEARGIFGKEQNDEMQARAEMVCVRAFWRLGETSQALALGHSVVVFSRSLQDPALMCEAWRIIGLVHSDVQQFNDAHECVGKALSFAEAGKDRVMVGECINSIGSVLFEEVIQMPASLERTTRLAMAERRFRQALEIAEQCAHLPSVSTALGNIGAVLIERGDFSGAYEITRQANALTLSGAARTNAAYDLVNMAECEYGLGRHQQALETLHKGLAQAERMGIRRVVRYAHNQLAEWYDKLGQATEAQFHRSAATLLADELSRDSAERKERIEALINSITHPTNSGVKVT
jgi:tetratricopeptide (TPR) repeat protein